jgi:hypothetical protein
MLANEINPNYVLEVGPGDWNILRDSKGNVVLDKHGKPKIDSTGAGLKRACDGNTAAARAKRSPKDIAHDKEVYGPFEKKKKDGRCVMM